MRCGKEVTGKTGGVKCNICAIWIHQECVIPTMTNKVYQWLKDEEKSDGSTSWSCRSCKTAFKKFTSLVTDLEGRISGVEGKVESQAKDIELNAKGVSHNKDKIASLEAKLDQVGEGGSSSENVFKEINERKLREAN